MIAHKGISFLRGFCLCEALVKDSFTFVNGVFHSSLCKRDLLYFPFSPSRFFFFSRTKLSTLPAAAWYSSCNTCLSSLWQTSWLYLHQFFHSAKLLHFLRFFHFDMLVCAFPNDKYLVFTCCMY